MPQFTNESLKNGSNNRERALSIRPNIPVWNSEYSMGRMEQYFPVRWTNPSQVIRFQVSIARKYEIKRKTLTFVYLLCGSSTTLKLKINDVLGEGDNITFTVGIWKVATTLYFPDKFKSHFRMTSELFTRAIMLTFHSLKLVEANPLQYKRWIKVFQSFVG